MRQCKYNMKIGNIKQFALSFHYPSFFGYLLAFGTMAVAATVVTDLYMRAFLAFKNMAPQNGCPAYLQCI